MRGKKSEKTTGTTTATDASASSVFTSTLAGAAMAGLMGAAVDQILNPKKKIEQKLEKISEFTKFCDTELNNEQRGNVINYLSAISNARRYLNDLKDADENQRN